MLGGNDNTSGAAAAATTSSTSTTTPATPTTPASTVTTVAPPLVRGDEGSTVDACSLLRRLVPMSATTASCSRTGSTPTTTAATPAARCSNGNAAQTSLDYRTVDGCRPMTATRPRTRANSTSITWCRCTRHGCPVQPRASGMPNARGVREQPRLTATPRCYFAATNRSKSDKDPANWQPPNSADWCDYASGWVQVKVKWRLTADQDEANALRNMLSGCLR